MCSSTWPTSCTTCTVPTVNTSSTRKVHSIHTQYTYTVCIHSMHFTQYTHATYNLHVHSIHTRSTLYTVYIHSTYTVHTQYNMYTQSKIVPGMELVNVADLTTTNEEGALLHPLDMRCYDKLMSAVPYESVTTATVLDAILGQVSDRSPLPNTAPPPFFKTLLKWKHF